MSTGCGCTLTLLVFAAWMGGLTIWIALKETGLIYPVGAGLLLWLLLTGTRRLPRRRCR